MKNNRRRFFCVLYSDETWVFDQSERAQGPIYILKTIKKRLCIRVTVALNVVGKDT